ncbi:putative mitochondrial carrier C29A3.11c [Candida viswanathii]|uniref:Mitochondrial thiamine pyrophosphate carrier 1 n=1 Tax=Candida viswanathii TaxID=5486 RepID=A0A367Y0U6_9ASCO|nr:putative mitochondrial carrier C29A3.11c [Candida viswanathii]
MPSSAKEILPPPRGIPAITGEIDDSRAFHIFPKELQPFRSTIIAYGASLFSTLVGLPFDAVKIRMQTHKQFTGYFDCFKKTYLKEGLAGFFRGSTPVLISTSFAKSLSVSLFTTVKPYTYAALYESPWTKHREEVHPFLRNIPVCFISGMISGAGVSLFACPFEFTKIYAQLERLVTSKSIRELSNMNAVQSLKQPIPPPIIDPKKSISTATIVKEIVKSDGISGLYSGFKYHAMRDSISTGTYYSIYESMKWAMNNFINKDPTISSPFSVLLAGGLSGALSWVLIFPVDTRKALVQKDAVTNILRKSHGLEPLPPKPRQSSSLQGRAYRGLGISITRSFIVNMVFFGAFELGMKYLA